MKALVQDGYGPPDVLELRDVDRPAVGSRDVLVRVRAAGVDRGVWHLMTGLPYALRLAGFGLRRPKVPIRGTDVAGTVEAVGAEVTRFEPGDEVFGTGTGTYAEYACATEDQVAVKPATLTFEQAAAMPASAFTALEGLRDVAGVTPGQKVLVIGAAGGVGTFAVQIAKSLGAEVTGVCSTSKVDLVASLGADHVVDYTQEDFADAGPRHDVILDMAGNRTIAHLRRGLAPDGTLVIAGGEGGGRWLGGSDRQVRALVLSRFVRQTLRTFVAKKRPEDLEHLRALAAAGELTSAVGRTYPLAAAPDAIRDLAQGRVRGKAVIAVSAAA